jgi:hypothetical protein
LVTAVANRLRLERGGVGWGIGFFAKAAKAGIDVGRNRLLLYRQLLEEFCCRFAADTAMHGFSDNLRL